MAAAALAVRCVCDTVYLRCTQALGKGQFGQVIMATDLVDGSRWACKSVSKRRVQGMHDFSMSDVLREVEVLYLVGGHPSVVGLREVGGGGVVFAALCGCGEEEARVGSGAEMVMASRGERRSLKRRIYRQQTRHIDTLAFQHTPPFKMRPEQAGKRCVSPTQPMGTTTPPPHAATTAHHNTRHNTT